MAAKMILQTLRELKIPARTRPSMLLEGAIVKEPFKIADGT